MGLWKSLILGDDVTPTLVNEFGLPLWTSYFRMRDLSAAIQVFDGVQHPCPSFANVEYGIPRSTMIQWIDLRTRQRSLTIELEYPLLDTDPVEDESGQTVLAAKHSPPTAKHVPIISEDYQNIVVDAPPYHSISFKVTNVQIVYMQPEWDSQSRKYTVEVIFKGPNDSAFFKLDCESPFPSLYQQPPP